MIGRNRHPRIPHPNILMHYLLDDGTPKRKNPQAREVSHFIQSYLPTPVSLPLYYKPSWWEGTDWLSNKTSIPSIFSSSPHKNRLSQTVPTVFVLCDLFCPIKTPIQQGLAINDGLSKRTSSWLADWVQPRIRNTIGQIGSLLQVKVHVNNSLRPASVFFHIRHHTSINRTWSWVNLIILHWAPHQKKCNFGSRIFPYIYKVGPY